MSNLIQDTITSTANRYGVPVDLAMSIAKVESNYNQSAIGSKGEVGVFQLMPSTARDLGVDASSLDGNVEGGISYLRQMYDKFGDWGTAILAYNAGPGNVSKGKIPSSSLDYQSKVLAGASIPNNEFVGMSSDLTMGSDLTVGSDSTVGNEEDSSNMGLSDMGKVVLGVVGIGVGVWMVRG